MLDLQSAGALVSGPSAQEQNMTKQTLTAIATLAAIAINGEHFDEGDILMVDVDVDLDTAKQLVRLGRAQPSDAKRGRRKGRCEAAEGGRPAAAGLSHRPIRYI
jgi:hypothetical protein